MKEKTTYGLELEYLVTDPSGNPLPLKNPEFEKMRELIGEGELHVSSLNGKEYVIGLKTNSYGELGLDAAMSLAEHAIRPTDPDDESGLQTLEKRALKSLAIANQAVMELHDFETAPAISMSMHPLAPRDMKTYRQLVTPKAVYEIIWRRGWQHNAGIHCAHTSPWTSVELKDAVDFLNVTLAFGGPLIAIFGNSPFQEGRVNGVKENRQNMWQMLLGNSRFPEDTKLVGMPEEKPQSLAHYFQLMFQAPVLVVTAEQTSDYKTSGLFTVEGDPSMIDFLARDSWTGLELGNPNLSKVEVRPSVAHFELQQFMHFWGARIRFALEDAGAIEPKKLREALLEDRAETFLESHLTMLCIEARDYGTALPSVADPESNPIITPSSLQAGLKRNLDKAKAFSEAYPWGFWKKVREEAVTRGLEGQVDGIPILELARNVVDIAAEGLSFNEQWMIQPAVDIVRTGKSRADILLEEFDRERMSRTDSESLNRVLERRRFPTKLIESLPESP